MFIFSKKKSAIEVFTLDNGLKIALENIPHRQSATVGIWLPMGSRFEKKEESGYSHFVEHMLFKGTKKRNYNEISRTIDRLGGYMNASTSKEVTDYYVTLSGRHLSVALDVLSDMFFDSTFSNSEFSSEKKVIIEEIKMSEDQPDDFLFDLFYSDHVGDNSLGRPIAGSVKNIERSKRDNLYAYYRSHYGARGAVLSLAGALYRSKSEKADLFKNIDRHFNRREHNLQGEPGFAQPSWMLSEFQSPREVTSGVFRHHQKNLEQMNFILSLPGEKQTYEQKADLHVLTHYLGGTMSSRLFIELREKRGLCYTVSAFNTQYLQEGIWGIYCGTSSDKYDKACEVAVAEIQAAVKGIPAADLEESKSGLKGTIELSMESAHRRANFNAKNILYYDEIRDWREFLSHIDEVTSTTVSTSAASLWNEKKISLTSLGPKIGTQRLKNLKNVLKEKIV